MNRLPSFRHVHRDCNSRSAAEREKTALSRAGWGEEPRLVREVFGAQAFAPVPKERTLASGDCSAFWKTVQQSIETLVLGELRSIRIQFAAHG